MGYYTKQNKKIRKHSKQALEIKYKCVNQRYKYIHSAKKEMTEKKMLQKGMMVKK